MSFEAGKSYTHERFMDVFIKVHGVLSNDPAIISIEWYNKGQSGVPYSHGVYEQLTITDLSGWSEL
jgi:hypothetical protein